MGCEPTASLQPASSSKCHCRCKGTHQGLIALEDARQAKTTNGPGTRQKGFRSRLGFHIFKLDLIWIDMAEKWNIIYRSDHWIGFNNGLTGELNNVTLWGRWGCNITLASSFLTTRIRVIPDYASKLRQGMSLRFGRLAKIVAPGNRVDSGSSALLRLTFIKQKRWRPPVV